MAKNTKYPYQARTIAAGAILSSMVSLGAVGVGMWLLIYSQDFLNLIGVPLRDAFAGYCVFAGYMTVTGIVGASVSMLRNHHGLLCFAVLLVSNLVCQGAIFTYLFLETKEVMSGMSTAIEENRDCRTFVTLEYKFHCTLETIHLGDFCRLNTEAGSRTELQPCSDDVMGWLEKGVWGAMGVSAVLIAFQVILLITSLMFRHVIRENNSNTFGCCYRRQVEPTPNLIHVTPAPSPLSSLPSQAWLESPPFLKLSESSPPVETGML